MENLKTNLDWAQYYRSIGWSPFPVGQDKKPLIEWKKYQTEIATEGKINFLWQMCKDANVGIATGKVSGLVVLDIDAKHGRSSKDFVLPVTVCAKTGGNGEHWFFKYPDRFVKSTNGLLFGEGVDIKADGGYVVAAPSLHQSGNQYEWIVGPDEAEIADIPDWLIAAIDKNQDDKKEIKLWKEGSGGVSEGQRNGVATSIAGKLVHSLPPELREIAGWAGLVKWNENNTPPLSEKELRQVWDSVAKYKPKTDINNYSEKTSSTFQGQSAIITCFADIQSEPISWLWEERIALGKLTLIAGDPGIGKSLISIAVASTISVGAPWPVDGTKAPVGDVIFISAEDDPADTVKPRLEAAGADCSKIHILQAVRCVETDSEGKSMQRMFSLKNDIPVLEKVLATLPNCKLIVVDPISAYLDGSDSHANADVRGLLAPLSELAAKYKVAVVAISHLNKNNNGNAMYRTMGSLAFVAAARAAFLVARDKDKEGRVLVLPIKNNIAKTKTGLAYSVMEAENGYPVMAWESEPVEMTADDALAEAKTEGEKSDTDWAIEYLKDKLEKGPISAVEVLKGSRVVGIKDKALRRAREKLGVKTSKSGYSGGWFISLPGHEDAQVVEDTPPIAEGNLDINGHLAEEVDVINEPDEMEQDDLDLPF